MSGEDTLRLVGRLTRERDAARERVAELTELVWDRGMLAHQYSCVPWGAPALITDCSAGRCRKVCAALAREQEAAR